jgi:copper chaperone CopZ
MAAELSEPTGAQEVSGHVTQRTVKVVYEPDRVALPVIVRAIEAAGHRVGATP